MSEFDWPGLMRAGLFTLRLQPRDFWALTPGELMLMLGADPGRKPLDRARLMELARSYPDRRKDDNDDRQRPD